MRALYNNDGTKTPAPTLDCLELMVSHQLDKHRLAQKYMHIHTLTDNNRHPLYVQRV